MGYDIKRFCSSDVNDEFICSICHDILQNPILVEKCQHIYCYECIHQWLENSPEKVCPNDRETITEECLRSPDRPFCNMIKNLYITCDFTDFGCGTRVKLDLLESHVFKCEFNPKFLDDEIDCQLNCGATIKRREIIEHKCIDYLKLMIEEKNIRIDELESENCSLKEEVEFLWDETNRLSQLNIKLESGISITQSDVTDNVPIEKLIDISGDNENKENNNDNDNHEIVENVDDNTQIVPNKPMNMNTSLILKRETSISNRNMIEELCLRGILTDSRTKEAMLAVDRGFFVTGGAVSYVLPYSRSIGFGAHTGPPVYDAKLLQHLEPHLPITTESFKILDVGFGSGYITACIALMGKGYYKIVGIDHIQQFVDAVNFTIKTEMPELITCDTVKFACCDGRFGYPNGAPYDLILIEPSTRRITTKLYEQLKPGGKIVVPMGSKGKDIDLELLTKQTNGEIIRQVISDDWRIREYVVDSLIEKKLQVKSGWKLKLGL